MLPVVALLAQDMPGPVALAVQSHYIRVYRQPVDDVRALLVEQLQRLHRPGVCTVALQRDADVKTWANEARMELSGIELCGMRGRVLDAARHALHRGVTRYGVPDPLDLGAVS